MQSFVEALVAPIALLLVWAGSSSVEADDFGTLRRRMVAQQIAGRGIESPKVLAAMEKVPRHLFVPEGYYRAHSYDDSPLPIGEDQTISQPYIVALMTSLVDLRGGEKVLEIGTGSGYQAAVLAEIARDVYTIEILEPLARRARRSLEQLGYQNVHVRHGDGFAGWPEEAPFDAIVVTAAPEEVPPPLLEQLKIGGKLVIPLGGLSQDLVVYTRTPERFEKREVIPVLFVPMTGKARESPTDRR